MVFALLGFSITNATSTLNSDPVSNSTIFLDFDGQDVNSSMWNYGTSFTSVPTTMVNAQITEAFNRLSEDFRPFNFKVTTKLLKFLTVPLDHNG